MNATPVGIFDSGIGGLSILQALRSELPQENFVYIADSGHAPYGERDDNHVIGRSRAITRHLRSQHGIKALVVACNTATAAAIDILRLENPDLPIVGVEPALKPAAALTRTQHIGVMATRGTLSSARFHALLGSVSKQARFICQPCDGLAEAIEHGITPQNTTDLIAICAYYSRAMGQFGHENDQIDTLVLGCTHYPFAQTHLRALVGPTINLLSTGEPVARQTRRLLQTGAVLQETGVGQIGMGTTGHVTHLKAAASLWLHWRGHVEGLRI
ncbi:MAG: glutamate racemase [Pseudomonadota bacterium]